MRFLSFLALALSLLAVPVSSQRRRAVNGEWGNRFNMKVIPIHAMLLPDGNVLVYGTNNRGNQGGGLYYEVWDVRSGKHQVSGNHNLLRHSTGTNTFCSTLNMDVSTGNILIMGGDDNRNNGIKDALEFNYRTHQIRRHPRGSMKYPRWYGTSINLPNGDIFVLGGRAENSKKASSIPEVWNPNRGFRALPGANVPAIRARKNGAWWYPHAYVNSRGDIIAIMHGRNSDVYRISTSGNGKITKIGTKPFDSDKLGPSVMFDVDKVAMLDNSGVIWEANISNSNQPVFRRKRGTGSARINGVMSPLPDGRVSLTGGCTHTREQGNTLSCAVKSVQIWDPVRNQVLTGPRENTARLYHSSGLVLPDATIFSAGGGAPGPLRNLNGQVYSPPYLFSSETGAPARRPDIQTAPRSIKAGATFTITVDSTRRVQQVTAVKSGAMTHARNCDARWLDLSFQVVNKRGGGGRGEIRVNTRNRNIMIPGLWTLYTIDNNGVPSYGHLIRVRP